MKQLLFFVIAFSTVLCVSSYARESVNKDRHTKERMVRFLNSQGLRFESFITRCENQNRLTPEVKQKLLAIQTTIINLKEAIKRELQQPESSFFEEEDSAEDDVLEFEEQESQNLLEENFDMNEEEENEEIYDSA